MPTAHLAASPHQIKAWLKPTATTSEQIQALEGLGLAPSELSTAASVTTHGLRAWVLGKSKPRPAAAIVIDDLRACARILVDSFDPESLEPDRVVSWLRGWNPELNARPLDIIASDPARVRAVALEETFDQD